MKNMEIPFKLYNELKNFLREIATKSNDSYIVNKSFDLSEQLAMSASSESINICDVSILKKSS